MDNQRLKVVTSMMVIVGIMIIMEAPGCDCYLVSYPGPEDCCSQRGTFGIARAEWRETSTAYIISIDIPGMKQADTKDMVRLINFNLDIERERGWNNIFRPPYLDEKLYGEFWKRFKLPSNAMLHCLETHLEDGVMWIGVPKDLDLGKVFTKPKIVKEILFRIHQPLMGLKI